MLEHIIDHLASVKDWRDVHRDEPEIRFAFHQLVRKISQGKTAFNFKIINDGTTSETDKLAR